MILFFIAYLQIRPMSFSFMTKVAIGISNITWIKRSSSTYIRIVTERKQYSMSFHLNGAQNACMVRATGVFTFTGSNVCSFCGRNQELSLQKTHLYLLPCSSEQGPISRNPIVYHSDSQFPDFKSQFCKKLL